MAPRLRIMHPLRSTRDQPQDSSSAQFQRCSLVPPASWNKWRSYRRVAPIPRYWPTPLSNRFASPLLAKSSDRGRSGRFRAKRQRRDLHTAGEECFRGDFERGLNFPPVENDLGKIAMATKVDEAQIGRFGSPATNCRMGFMWELSQQLHNETQEEVVCQ
jgi:hypothetical protein